MQDEASQLLYCQVGFKTGRPKDRQIVTVKFVEET